MATKAVQNGRSPVDKQKQRNDKAEESYPTGLAFLTRDKSKSTQKIYSHYRRTYLQKHTKTKSSGTGSMITLATSVKGCFFIGEVQYVCRSTFRCGSLEQVEVVCHLLGQGMEGGGKSITFFPLKLNLDSTKRSSVLFL